MKFALVGTHSSGKTTALWYIGSELKRLGFSNATLVQEVARDCPYKMAEKATFEKGVWIVTNQILAEMKAELKWKYVVCDRSVFDNIYYYESTFPDRITRLENENYKRIDFLRQLAYKWAEMYPYEKIFFFRPLPLVVDVDRNPDEKYQKRIDRLFLDELELMPNVYFVNQSKKEERSKYVLDEILEAIKHG